MLEIPNRSRERLDAPDPNVKFGVDAFKSSDFWVDYENGDFSKFRFSVEVFGDFSDYEVSFFRGRGSVSVPLDISDREELEAILLDKIRLWSKDFIIMLRSDYMVVLKNRGLRWRLLRDSARVRSVSNFISKFFKPHKKSSKVVFLTLTYDHSKYSLVDAWRDLRRRFHRTVRYFKRHYGVICALGVVEAHDNLYPHLHMIILLMSSAPVFKYKGVRRFCEKKVKWDKALAKEGFIDALAPKRPNDISNYLTKYMSKVMMELSSVNEVESILNRPKALTPFICRLFRIPLVFVYPKGLDKKLYRPIPKPIPQIEELPIAKAIWDIKYRKPINGVSPNDNLEYLITVKKYLDDTLRDYFSKMIGKEPKEKPYDLIYILSSIQSPPNEEIASWQVNLLYTLHECTKEVIVLGYCEVFLVS